MAQEDANLISDWQTFHNVFAEQFGFPVFYGRNMDAWVDCLSY
ncbi:barstar family protein, partial [Pseudomonas viridiflava]